MEGDYLANVEGEPQYDEYGFLIAPMLDGPATEVPWDFLVDLRKMKAEFDVAEVEDEDIEIRKDKMKEMEVICGCGVPDGNGVLYEKVDGDERLKVEGTRELLKLYMASVINVLDGADSLPELKELWGTLMKLNNDTEEEVKGNWNLSELMNEPAADSDVESMRAMMTASLSLMKEIRRMSIKILGIADQFGLIPRKSKLNGECIEFAKELIAMLKALGELSHEFKLNFSNMLSQWAIVMNLDICIKDWFKTLHFTCTSDNMRLSDMDRLVDMCNLSCSLQARITLLFCYVGMTRPKCETHNFAYDEVSKKALSVFNDFETKFKGLLKLPANESESGSFYRSSVSFTRAWRIRREYKVLLSLHTKLGKLIEEGYNASCDLVTAEEVEQESSELQQECRETLRNIAAELTECGDELQKHCEIQAILTNDLFKNAHGKGKEIAPAVPNTPKSSSFQDISGETVLPQSEEETRNDFSSSELDEDTDVEEQTFTQDEVFVALFKDDDLEQPCAGEERDPDEESGRKLYSGVVDQLKTALKPVKSKMMEREKSAVTKVVGDIDITDVNSTDDDGKTDEHQLTQRLSSSSTELLSTDCDDADLENRGVSAPPLMFSSNFMNELSGLLASTLGVRESEEFVSEGVEDYETAEPLDDTPKNE